MTSNRIACSTRVVLYTLIVSLVTGQFARAYTPDHPEVKAMVAKGVAFLAGKHDKGIMNQMGAQALLGLAILKAGFKNHPRIAKCVSEVRRYMKEQQGARTYNLGVSVIFLCELNAEKYKAEIETLLKRILALQRDDGAWSYYEHHYGDTSQTQYAALCLWYAERAGFKHLIRKDATAKMVNWLMRTQDISGSFGYHPRDPGSFTRVKQNTTVEMGRTVQNFSDKPSDFSAGMSALVCGADLLGYGKRVKAQTKKAKKNASNIPTELREIKKVDPNAGRFASGLVDENILRQAIGLANGWFNKNYTIQTDRWQYYYLYGLERFKSYEEILTGQSVKEPRWYNDGVDYLKGAQNSDGSWHTPGKKGAPAINTAFAILFLVRSTKKTLARRSFFDDSGLVFKLPKSLGKVGKDGRIQEGKIDEDTKTIIDNILNNKTSDAAYIAKFSGADLLSRSEKERRAQVKRLQEMVRKGTFGKRRAAVKLLSTSGKIDDQTVSLIIYALTDPDYRVVNEARDGLRFMSRRLEGFGLKRLKNNTDVKVNAKGINQAVAKWKQWYRSIRPTAKFTVFGSK